MTRRTRPQRWGTAVVLAAAAVATTAAVTTASWWWTAVAGGLLGWLAWRTHLEVDAENRRRARPQHPGADESEEEWR